MRSLYFYDGDVLYDRSIQYIVNNEVPRLQQGNVDLVAYNEAVARVLKIAGGLSGIFA